MALTPKQQRFVQEYLVDLNATQASIRAGYSADTAYSIGHENLSKPEIAEALREAQAERAKRTEITQDRVLQELAKIGFSDIRRVVKWGSGVYDTEPEESQEDQPHGGALKRGSRPTGPAIELVGSHEIDDTTAAAILEISQTSQGVKVKLGDKLGALTQMGRHLGMFTDKTEFSGTVNVVASDQDERL